MATSNTQVTVYLPDNILEYVESYCKKFGIVRKKDDKAILATGIVDLLTMIVNTPIEDLADNKTLPNQDIEGIIEKKLSDSKLLSKLLDTLLDNSELMQRLKDGLVPNENLNYCHTLPSNLPDNLPEEQEDVVNEIEDLMALTQEDNEVETSEVKSLEDAIEQVIIPMVKEGKKLGEIEKILEGKYRASSSGKSTKWKGCLSRLVNKLKKEGKV